MFGVKATLGLSCLALFEFLQLTAAQTFEAEAGTLVGVTTATTTSGYSGSGYVTGFDATTDTVTVWPWITTAGSYPLSIRYSAATGEKKGTVLVDGASVGEVTLPACTGFCTVSFGNVYLKTGTFDHM